jgi:hypothetical protein
MPISKDKMKLYPGGGIRSPEWLEIRARIRLRAHDLCEGCGVVNGAIGLRLPDGSFLMLEGFAVGEIVTIPYQLEMGLLDGVPVPFWGTFTGKTIRIVCTVAHVDDDLVDHSDDNLAFWCQQCHNRNDANGRAARRKGKNNGD